MGNERVNIDWELECKRLTEELNAEKMKHCEEVACLKEKLESVAGKLDRCNLERANLEGQVDMARLIFGGDLGELGKWRFSK